MLLKSAESINSIRWISSERKYPQDPQRTAGAVSFFSPRLYTSSDPFNGELNVATLLQSKETTQAESTRNRRSTRHQLELVSATAIRSGRPRRELHKANPQVVSWSRGYRPHIPGAQEASFPDEFV